MQRRRRRSNTIPAAVQTENLETRQMLDASGMVADAAGFKHFESREAYEEALIQQALTQYEHLFDQADWGYLVWNQYVDEVGIQLTNFTSADQSGTNNQVSGVDEADLVENSGTHLFVANDNRVTIFDVQDPENMKPVGVVEAEGQIHGIFLDGDTLTTISNARAEDVYTPVLTESISDDTLTVNTLSFFSSFRSQWDNSQTVITSFDVSDTASPELISETKLDGAYRDSRAIDGEVHVITNHNVGLPAPRSEAVDDDTDLELAASDQPFAVANSSVGRISGLFTPVSRGRYESRDSYEKWIRENIDTLIDNALPQYQVTMPDGTSVSGPMADVTDTPMIHEEAIDQLLSVTTVDIRMEEPDVRASQAVFARAGYTTYANEDNLYLASTKLINESQTTDIVQFAWGTAESPLRVVASGVVPGRLLNQFAMDEHDGHLRIATTSGNRQTPANNVLILKETEGRLDQVGAIENFEQGESIFAVRFDGDEAFIVTFEQIDPLFVLDLGDPTDPRIVGELKVPGVSDHIARIDENHLLAIGRIDGTLKVSVYDISDRTNPTLVDEDVAPPNTLSSATYNHKAFGWYPEHGVLAVPIYRNGQSALFTVQVDVDKSGDDVISHNRWVKLDQNIMQSAYIGDVLFTIGPSQIVASDIANPSDKISTGYAGSADGASSFDDIDIVATVVREAPAGADVAPQEIELTAGSGRNKVVVRGNQLTITNNDGSETFELGQGTNLVIRGSEYNDDITMDLRRLTGGILNSVRVETGFGNDSVRVNGVADGLQMTVDTGGGNDSVTAADRVRQGIQIIGGSGNDDLEGGHGNDVINGGSGDDKITGGNGHDRLIGHRGSDQIWGLNGNDTVLGGGDADKLHGGRGDDLIRGGIGNDWLYGSNGDDVLEGNDGDDRVHGNLGDDTFLDVALASLQDHFAGGVGKDQFIGGQVPVHQIIDRLFDFAQNEDLIKELFA